MGLHYELPVYKASYDLLLEIFQFTKDFSKEYKYTIGESLKKETIELLIRVLGTVGLRDKEALKSALTRPYQTFEGQDLYPTPQEKAAAVLESIISNHSFLDGNKRLGFVLMKLILLEVGLSINSSHEEVYNFIIQVATGEHNIDSITDWIKLHVKQNK